MKMKLILGLLLTGFALAAAKATTNKVDTLKWTFNRTNNTITFSFPVTNGWHYSLARYDIKHQYYDTPTNWMSDFTGTNTFTIHPDEIHPDNEGRPTPSGQYIFYMVKQTWP